MIIIIFYVQMYNRHGKARRRRACPPISPPPMDAQVINIIKTNVWTFEWYKVNPKFQYTAIMNFAIENFVLSVKRIYRRSKKLRQWNYGITACILLNIITFQRYFKAIYEWKLNLRRIYTSDKDIEDTQNCSTFKDRNIQRARSTLDKNRMHR